MERGFGPGFDPRRLHHIANTKGGRFASIDPYRNPHQLREGERDMVDERPIDGGRWGEWVRGGTELWEVVRRSYSVFARNTTELMNILNIPSTDAMVGLQLMGDDREATAPYWEQLDQRLHNQLASAVSLIDHQRRLLSYYVADFPAVVADYSSRNDGIIGMGEAAFLRDLRNYLLHYGAAPVLQTFELGQTEISRGRYLLKLSAEQLLRWDGWKAAARGYLSSFGERDGPLLGRDVATYATAMGGLFAWLFEQRQVVMDGANVPNRLRIEV
jgi:hypothetical protein